MDELVPTPDFACVSLFPDHISSPSPPFFLPRTPPPPSSPPLPLPVFAFFSILFFVEKSSKNNIPFTCFSSVGRAGRPSTFFNLAQSPLFISVHHVSSPSHFLSLL